MKKEFTEAKTALTVAGISCDDTGNKILRELCEVGLGRAVGDHALVTLGLFSFVTRHVGLSSMDAFTLCRHFLHANQLRGMVTKLGKQYRAASGEWGKDPAPSRDEFRSLPVTINNGRYVTWPGTSEFYDMQAGEWGATLPTPLFYFTGWDITANLLDMFTRAEMVEKIMDKDK